MPPKSASDPKKPTTPSLGELYEPGAFVVARTPLLPLAPADGELPGPRQALTDATIAEAIYLASPELRAETDRWLASDREDRKLEQSLQKYLARMRGRCTPFGLFAGVATGAVGGETRLEVAPRPACQRRTRLDMHALCAVVATAARQPGAVRALRYRPNASLYEAAGRVRYAEMDLSGRKGAESFPLVDVEPTEHLSATLARAASGASFEELVEHVLATLGAEPGQREAVDDYVERLIEAQILVAEVLPTITGELPTPRAVAELGQSPALAREAAALGRVQGLIEALDREPLGAPVARYEAITAALRELPGEVNPKMVVQVDLHRPSPGLAVSPALAGRVLGAATLVQRFARTRPDGLSGFREAFEQRYEGREVPLAEVLDEDLGLGFDRMRSGRIVPLLEGLPLGRTALAEGAPLGAHEQWLLQQLEARRQPGMTELRLDEGDLPAGLPPRQLPEGFVVMVSLARSPGAPLDEALLVEPTLHAPSGAQLLGRFGHVDPDLARALGEHLREEEAREPDVLFADLAYLPQGRLGNVMLRPVLRSYEIPYHGRSGAPPERQLPLADLRVSVVGGRVRLRSARLGREVRIRNTNAHNFQGFDNLPIYTFLCSLQWQDSDLLGGFGWGALEALPHRPRVRCGDVVLSRAHWRLTARELEAAQQAGAGAAAVDALGRVREARALPRHVALEDGDNVLPVDLDDARSVEAFLATVKKRPTVSLEEVLPTAAELAAEGPEGRYALELVVPFLRRSGAAAVQARAAGAAVRGGGKAPPPGEAVDRPAERPVDDPRLACPRSFAPGSSWLYFKVYSGESQQNALLAEALGPALRGLEQEGVAESWFFLRYADPGSHLRVRVRGEPAALLGRALPALQAAIDGSTARRGVWKTQLDTYEREVERYGGVAGMVRSEDLFAVDSGQCLEVVAALLDEGPQVWWLAAAAAMQGWLVAFGLDADARLRFCREAAAGYAHEMGAGEATRHALGERFRRDRRALAAALGGEADGEPLRQALGRLQAWEPRRREAAAAIRQADERHELTETTWTLLRSYLHMTCIRMLPQDGRRQEYVIYELLVRHHESQQARSRAASAVRSGGAS